MNNGMTDDGISDSKCRRVPCPCLGTDVSEIVLRYLGYYLGWKISQHDEAKTIFDETLALSKKSRSMLCEWHPDIIHEDSTTLRNDIEKKWIKAQQPLEKDSMRIQITFFLTLYDLAQLWDMLIRAIDDLDLDRVKRRGPSQLRRPARPAYLKAHILKDNFELFWNEVGWTETLEHVPFIEKYANHLVPKLLERWNHGGGGYAPVIKDLAARQAVKERSSKLLENQPKNTEQAPSQKSFAKEYWAQHWDEVFDDLK